jgi:hypothetical protein
LWLFSLSSFLFHSRTFIKYWAKKTPPNYPELLSILPNLEQLLIQEPDFVLNLMRRRYDTMRANPQFTRGGGMQQEDTRVKKALRARGIDVRYFPTFSLDK